MDFEKFLAIARHQIDLACESQKLVEFATVLSRARAVYSLAINNLMALPYAELPMKRSYWYNNNTMLLGYTFAIVQYSEELKAS
jgi:hypothetical protein